MLNSSLHDESTFYPQFVEDLLHASREVVIESPFITTQRMKTMYPIFEKLIVESVSVYIFTRDPAEHPDTYEVQSEEAIQRFEDLGVQVLLCVGNHHRKLAIIDRKILWEGSLNILSQVKSREIMRRIPDKKYALEMFEFLNFASFI